MGRPPVPLEKRYWKSVDKRELHECWGWRASLTQWGYGQIQDNTDGEFSVGRGKMLAAHRLAYYYEHGEMPDGHLHHECENKWCQNPHHLTLTTNWGNVRLGDSPPAKNARKENCPRCGDEYRVSNSTGKRYCRRCKTEKKRQRRNQ